MCSLIEKRSFEYRFHYKKGAFLMAKTRYVAAKYVGAIVALCALTGGLPACGSGGGGSGPAPVASGLSPDAAPTGKLPGSMANAEALYAEVQDGFTQLVKAAATPANLPGVSGITETLQCSELASGGSGSITIDTNATSGTPTAGTTASITYNNCTIASGAASISLNGTLTETYTSYSSPTDFSATLALDMTANEGGKTSTVDLTEVLTVSGTTETVTFVGSNGASLSITASEVVTNGNDETITNATYVYDSSAGGGVLKAVFNNWEVDTTTGRAIGGTVTITGANGAKVVITATPTGYTATFTDSSGTTTYTVKYP
jgi:hypothetical protein